MPRDSARSSDRRPLVVCVDDEPDILSALRRSLRHEPYEMRTTTDPEEALDWVRKDEVALLLADYKMPRMSGTTLLSIVKTSSPRTARVMLTGYPGETLVIAAGEAGLMDLLGKPWDDQALRGIIRQRLSEREAS